jgi:hypothetical protein
MIEQAVTRLDQLAKADATVAPLARLEAEALRAVSAGGWDDGAPALDPQQAEQGVPLLHGQVLRVDGDAQRRLLVRLAELTGQTSAGRSADAMPIARAVEHGAFDAVALLACTVTQDGDGFQRLNESAGLDATLLATLAQVAALPLLLACGRRAGPLLGEARWQAGFCPVCAAWPTLAEMRGLARDHFLRCGRRETSCGAGCDTLLDVLRASRDQQHIEHVGILFRWANDFVVEAHFFHREGDVLIRLHFDLTLELVLAQGPRHLDDFGDRRITTDGHGHVFGAGTGALYRTLDRLTYGARIDDGFFIDRVRRGCLSGIGLHAILATTHADLDELHRGGGDVQTDQGSGFGG